MKKINLAIIDPQNSFCKEVPLAEQQKLHDGELCVKGAWDDMLRLTSLVDRLAEKIDDVVVTLDSHNELHIANPGRYRDSKGRNPDPFTLMRVENGSIIGSKVDASGNLYDVGEYFGIVPKDHKVLLQYLTALANAKRYPHCIWPPHCLIGTAGHNVVAPLFEALINWERKNFATVNYVTKGSNPNVEHFSAVRAEVADANDPNTLTNSNFIAVLAQADEVLFAGEAGSHCLANTVRDIANEFKDDSFIKKCVLLKDATSPVPGFEKYQDDFITEMTGRGMKITTTKEYLA